MSFDNYQNEIFDYFYTQMTQKRPNLNVVSAIEPSPAKFPVCGVYEIGNRRLENRVTMLRTDEQCESTYEVQVFSNSLGGSYSEANAIMSDADAVMNALGFIRYSRARIDNADARIYRVYARYRRIITGADSIPPKLGDEQ